MRTIFLSMSEAAQIIRKLRLTSHPEGGYFRETYRAKQKINENVLPKNFVGDRNISTSIYFLLDGNQVSHFHKLMSDELWHFYKGSPIILHCLNGDNYKKILIGNNFSKGELPQCPIKAGTWFAAEIKNKKSYSLVGCTVSPGFDFADFKLAKRSELLKRFPNREKLILRFTNN
ncbi:MAG: cupin domain-containing protein [Bacteroidetes bacterium]|nr:cupin domain-containing protein [Bacteroidota bacterium]MCL6097490.1 cupin domain-containing protein [Bacteroidota bacterium]